MPDQIGIKPFPGDLDPTDDPGTSAVHPPRESYGPGSAAGTGGTGDGDDLGHDPSITGVSRDGS